MTHSVSEAVMLSDRVVVLSARPAEVVADISVDLPRPRRAELTRSQDFTEIVDAVFAALAEGMAEPQPKAAQ